MAEEEQEEAAAKPKGGKGLIITLVVVVVLLLGAVAGGGYYLYSQGVLDQLTNKDDAAKTDSKKDEENEEDEELTKLYPAKFENIVLNITKNNGRNALMKLAFTIKSLEEGIEERATSNSAEILDSVISIISTKTAEELRTLGGKEVLKEELLLSINDILNEDINEDNEDSTVKDGVKKLFYINFVIK